MKHYVLISVLCYFNLAHTQDCTRTLLGEIKDFHDGTSMSGATIYDETLNTYTAADINGKFTIKNLCDGKLILVISHVGCETKRVTVDINGDTFIAVNLEHHLEELNEVMVSAGFKDEKTSIQQSISKKQIENYTDKSLGDALSTVSGVSSLNTGNTIVKPMIHGLHSSRLLIVNNNVRLFDQEWGHEHAPNIDINASSRIDVIKGANSLMYGSDAIGGLILVRPKNYAIKDSLFGSTSLSLNSNGWGGNINSELVKTYKNGFYGKIQGSYKRFGDFNAPDYMLSNTGIKSVNTSVRIGFKSFEKGFDAYYSFVDNTLGILRTSHIGNTNDLVRAINSGEPEFIGDFSYDINNPKQSVFHHLGKIEAYKRFKEFGKLTVQYDFQINRRKEFDLRRGDRANVPVVDLRLFTTSFQPNLKIDAYENLTLNTGFLLRYQQNDAISGTGTSPLIPDYDKYDFGAYAIGSYSLDLFSEISAGFRYDFSRIEASKRYRVTDWDDTYNYDELFPEFNTGTIQSSRYLTNPEFSFHNISASLGYLKHFSNDYELVVNYGLASRVPNPSELFSEGLHHSAARIEIGQLTMDKEIANKFMVSLEKNSRNFGFTISPYYKYISNFIQLIPIGTTTTVRGAFPVWEHNQTNAQIFGVDLDLNKKITNNLNYLGSISVLQGDNITEDIPLINMPATNFSNGLTYANENLNQLSIGLTQKTVLQQNRFPDYNFNTFNAILQQDVFVDISATPPTYTLFNFNSSATFKVFKSGTMKVDFNVENVFNISYREHLNRLRYFADELGRNFNIKLKINY